MKTHNTLAGDVFLNRYNDNASWSLKNRLRTRHKPGWIALAAITVLGILTLGMFAKSK